MVTCLVRIETVRTWRPFRLCGSQTVGMWGLDGCGLQIAGLQDIKRSHNRAGQALRVPGRWGSQISKQSAHEGGNVVSPTHRPSLPHETLLVLISVRIWDNSRAIVRPEVLCQWKIPTTPSGIEPATFRLVAHCLNQLRHRVDCKILRGISRAWYWCGPSRGGSGLSGNLNFSTPAVTVDNGSLRLFFGPFSK